MWLLLDSGSADVPTGVGLYISAITFAISLLLKFVDRGKSKRQREMLAIPPSNPTPQAGWAFADPSVTGKIHEANVSLARSDWIVGELRDEMAAVRRDMAAVSDDQRRTAAELVKTQTQLVSAEAKAQTAEAAAEKWRAEATRLERERDACEARARALLDELVDRKRELSSTHSTTPESVVTPLRPPKFRR